VAPKPGEPVIVKACVDPLVGSPLNSILRGHGVRRLLIGGVTTNHVVESTARHAADLGYEVFVIEEMCASFNSEMHDFSIGLLPTVFAEPVSIARYEELLAP
jgi:nicotinamidase-related amidase